MIKHALSTLLLLTAAPAMAQTAASAPAQILVSASGTMKTPPDMATIAFTLRGEGATSDEAATQLRDGARKASASIAALLGKQYTYHTTNFAVAQVRSKDCDANNYGQARLSTGACAIIGYIATMPVTVDTPRVADAATLTGLVSRLGATDVAIRSFWLRDDTAARRQAMAAALASARDQARAIAEGAGAKLGPLLRVQDGDYHEIEIEMPTAATARDAVPPPPPPPPPPAPVSIDVAPEPIQTTARVMAAYGIER